MASSESDVHSLLATLRDSPIDNSGASDKVLGMVYNYLMAVPAQPPYNVIHWFCRQAAPDTVAAATFLIRLFAYNSQLVEDWKTKLHSCLSRCSDCVQGVEQVKVSSRNTYFGAFQEDILKGFYQTLEQWELAMVTQDLINAKILDQSTTKTLSDIHPAVVYRMVCNWTIFSNPNILSAIYSSSLTDPLPGWPTDPLPPGMFVLLMSDRSSVRQWAVNQALKCTTVPMSNDLFVGSYLQAIEAVVHALTLSEPSHLPDSTLKKPFPFSVARDPSHLWSGFSTVLRHIPVVALTSDMRHHVDLRRIVTGHLHDTGPQFTDILQCLLLLLKRMDKAFWVGEGPEFPKVVFDSVKDNPSFSQLLQNISSSIDRPWFLSWFREYLHTIRDLPVYGEVLVKIADFLCEETQHERFQDARPSIMASALHLLSSVLRKSSTDNLHHRNSLLSALDIHTETFLGIAFSRSYDVEKWTVCRSSARAFLKNVLEIDVQSVTTTIMGLCKLLAQVQTGRPHTSDSRLSVRKQMWNKLYPAIQTNDADGVAVVFAIVAQTAHVDVLHKKPFASAFEVSSAEETLNEINRSLSTIREGFIGAMTHYADVNTSSSALDLLRRPGVVQDAMKLMLSPVEDMQLAAQNVVELAFDVDARHDCFRALLENLPVPGLEGLFDFLSTFIDYAPQLPEACSLSKSLVRCFTDIIDVLCTTPNGLLHSQYFLQSADDNGPAAKLPKLWNLMARSLTVIFRRTPLWSTYFDNEEMIVWMRDALIFGRDMLATWRVVETAANTRSTVAVASNRLSNVGRKMMNDLQDVLQELARWLRLTDEELLHQSFSLLKSLLECFREVDVAPSEDALKKLRKHIDSARKEDPKTRIRLDKSRLLTLEAALDEFDEVVVVSGPAPSAKDSAEKKKQLKQDDARKAKLASESFSKPLADLPASRPSKSRFFTDDDQQKLAATVSVPSFRRADKLGTKPAAPTSTQSTQAGPKNEGLAKPPPSDASSSSESESEEEGANQGLAVLAKLQRSPKIKKIASRRQIKTLDIPTHSNPMQERLKRKHEARNAALRLNPDISNLHKALLSWDFEHTGSEPPGEKPKLTQIPDRFNSFEEYKAVFEPLLLMECWAQILQAKEEVQDSFECQINSRQFLDSWLDLDISLLGGVKKDWYLAETDVVLLRHPIAKKVVMAKTQSYRATPHGCQASVRCYIRPGSIDPGLQISTKWQLSKLFSLSTLHREYAALVSVAYYDLFETILHPRLSQAPRLERRDIEQTMAKYSVNEPQATAIVSSLQTNGFVLIQGPPGTGKTSTICGLIAASLAKQRPPPVLVQAGRNTVPLEKRLPGKILLCAPSNAAIDEVASRISLGFRGSETGSGSVKVVRLGAKNAMSNSVQDISLDTLVEKKLDSDPNKSRAGSKDISMEISALRRDIDSLKQTMAQKRQKENTIYDNLAMTQALNDEISQLRSRKMTLSKQLDNLIDKNRSETRTLDALRRKTRVEVVREADVVCSTLSGAGHDLLAQFDFEMVIIDEAAQAIELSSIIPLKYRTNRCVMVGDPQQLPPTVLSREACRFRYNESLFVRLQKQRPDAVHLLSIQYRMHPDISRLPSQIFYQGRLQDGPSMEKKTKQPWHTHAKLGTYRFFNVAKGLEEASGRSIKNMTECQVAVALYSRLCQEFSSVALRVGVVSMYKAQVVELRRQFEQRFGRDIVESVDFNTVDGFQGQEKDVIILSCVRAGPGLQSIGFLSDIRRMNVALTRARSSLFILGNAPTLERSDATWKTIVLDARSRSALFDADSTYFTRPTVNQPAPLLSLAKETKAVPSVPVPSDLVTPRDFKSTIGRKPETIPLQALSDHRQHAPVVHVGAKRPAEDEDQSSRPPPTRPGEDPTKPRVPPAKRPKQPPNIFIPKSNKKRP